MVATITMSPPRPPSPPLGPPRGTYFSRRNARHPLPPSPAFTVILASSTSIKKAAGAQRPQSCFRNLPLLFGDRRDRWLHGSDAHKPAHAAAIAKLHDPGDLREKSIVLTPAHIRAGLQRCTALTDNNRTAGDELPTE